MEKQWQSPALLDWRRPARFAYLDAQGRQVAGGWRLPGSPDDLHWWDGLPLEVSVRRDQV